MFWLDRQRETTAHRKKPSDEEHRIQCACVTWFRYEHHTLSSLLFAIPNGGKRDAVTGAKLKAEGALAGVADLFLSVASNQYHGLYIEMKTATGRQSPSQKEFENNVTAQGFKYVLCRSLDDFMKCISQYLRKE